MPTEGAPTDCVIRQNPAPINRPGPVSWIPACAGMTARGYRDGDNPILAPVIMPAQAEITTCAQPASPLSVTLSMT